MALASHDAPLQSRVLIVPFNLWQQYTTPAQAVIAITTAITVPTPYLA